MEQFKLQGYWSAFVMSEHGYPLLVYECSVCHKFTYKGKSIVVPLDECPNCHSQMFEDEDEYEEYEDE
jgi:predicted Zn-ribbon and HTH transcriptional regulator